MIKTKKELKDFLKQDAKVYGINNDTILWCIRQHLVDPMHYQSINWKYVKTLRYSEYYFNNRKRNLLYYLKFVYYIGKLRRLSLKTGIQVPMNVVGKGFAIWHWGSVVIGADKIGENFRIGNNTLIGKKTPNGTGPKIGNNVYLCAGSMIIGDITIGNNVTIAPNSVVLTDVPDNCLAGGTPAKIIKRYD